MEQKSNWLSAYSALPLALKLPCEITSFKLDQFGAGQAAANLCFIDLFATVCSSRAEGAQLGGGEGWHLGLCGSAHGPTLCGLARGQRLSQCVGFQPAQLLCSTAPELGHSGKADAGDLAQSADLLALHRFKDLPQGFSVNSLVHLWIVLQ